MSLTPNTRLGPYEIVAPLGAGGMGEVYRARDTRLDRDVAIKVLPEATARDPQAMVRFEREAKAVAALSHPNILAIHDVGHENGISFVVTELLEGETLRERMRRSAISWRQAVEIIVSVCDGLAAAHAKGVIHRDLKPENLFITTAGHVKILDFGLARMDAAPSTSTHAAQSTPTITLATRPGAILGTPSYMSPEQVRGVRTDHRSDIFSLGCVLYEMVAGRRAFTGDTPADIMTAILKEEPVSLADAGTGIRPELDGVIIRCLEKKPEQRFQSATDLAFSLRSILAHSSAAPVRKRPRLPWPAKAAIFAFVAGGLLAGAFMVRRELGLVRRGARETIDSLAVLPMENVSRDPDQEYFVDGMTDALISHLAKIGSLKVISRTSVMRYKATTKSLPEIAKELNVDAVVEGSVLRVGERVRITAQLIHAGTDEHLWAESYDRELRDVLSLHGELARTIAQEIKVTLTPQEQARMAAARPVNPEAHQAYLKGRFHWNKRTSDGLQKSVEYFEQAVSLAPDWPLGYAGLADAYLMMPSYSSVRPSEAIPKARAAAAKALEMDESLAEAHASLGWIACAYDWDWRAAEREFERAIALSPNYATGHFWYALLLTIAGRRDEAIREITKAQDLDPLSLIIGTNVGWVHYCAGNLEQAETRLRKTLELGPDFAMAHQELAMTLFLQGRFAEAITEAREAVRHSNNNSRFVATLGYVCAKAGQVEEARRILDELTARSMETYVAPTSLAMVFAGLDDRDRMFEWLERAYQERDARLTFIQTDPLWAPMRSDPRFADLVRRVGLQPLPALRDSDPPLSPLNKGGGRGVPAGKIMLAVLPFENLSRDPDEDYFSDGLTEEMISQLSRLNPRKLGVIARTSAMHYRNTAKTVDVIGRELGVAYIVEGSVRRAGERVRITVQLVAVSDQTHLWANSYERDLKDIFALQSDVAERVAGSLTVELLPTSDRVRTINPEAYQAYLKGRFYWNNRTRAGMQKAIEHFRRANELDPHYAPAYAGMADSYTHLARNGHLSPKEAFPLAKQAALQAVGLDESLAEAHGALAFIALYFDWDWGVAERELRRAVDLNSSYEEAHHQYSHLLLTVGRRDESLIESQRALVLNPLDLLLNVHLGWHYMLTRHYDQAITQLRSVLEMDPNHYQALRHIGWAYMYNSLHTDAIAALETARNPVPDNAQATAALAAAYAAGGRGSDARLLLGQLESSLPQRYVSACDIAAVYAALNEIEVAFDWLEKAYEERSPRMVELRLDPVFDPMRTDPRFADLLLRVGLPEIRNPAAPVADPKGKDSPGASP